MVVIKYRAKRKDNGEWVYGFYYEQAAPLQCITCEGDEGQEEPGFIIFAGFADWGMPRPMQGVEIDKKTLGQYTGIKANHGSSKGKEIYAGDIVVKTPMLVSNEEVFKGVVVWSEGAYWIDNGRDSISLFAEADSLEIVGNIHDVQRGDNLEKV